MYFQNIPEIGISEKPIKYPFSSSEVKIAKNFFRRYKVNEDVFSFAVFFQKYAIEEGERPDTLAKKAYDNVHYDWIILITNNMINAQYDWPMDSNQLYNTLATEYTDPFTEIHHYETIEIAQYKAGTVVDETFYNATHKLNINGSVQDKVGSSFVNAIPVAEHFFRENEKKREIYLLKPNYVASFVDDFRKNNMYEKSSTYVNKRLKSVG